jgi:hypothetical protein
MNKMTILVGPGAREEGGGLTNFMSWPRFERMLRVSGEVKQFLKELFCDHNLVTVYRAHPKSSFATTAPLDKIGWTDHHGVHNYIRCVGCGKTFDVVLPEPVFGSLKQ